MSSGYPEQLLIAANSPGEVAGWLAPILAEVRRSWPECRVTVLLLPCPFATGSESRVLLNDLKVDEVIPSKRYFRLFAEDPRKGLNTVLLHLGGDLMYSAALIWRWNIPAWSYLWGRRWWDWAFRGYLVKDIRNLKWMRAHRLPLRKAIKIGDLVADDVRLSLNDYVSRHQELPEKDPNLVTFLPGSRYVELEGLTPFFLETAALMRSQNQELHFQMLLSPFIDDAKAAKAVCAPPHPAMGGIQGHLNPDDTVSCGSVSVKLIRKNRLPHLRSSGLCITIPGTKTAETACLGVPELMILPLNRPECLPYIGILGLLDWIPGGSIVKGRILLHLKDKAGLQALPNLAAQKEILPELIGVLTPQETARRAMELFNNKETCLKQKDAFAEIYTPSLGAAGRILTAIEKSLKEDPPEFP